MWLAVFTACLTLLLSEGAITGSDGRSMYEVGKSVVERGSIDVDQGFGFIGRGGLYYGKAGFGLSVVAAAAYAAARPIARHTRFADLIEQAAVASTMPIICALLAAALYLLSRRLEASPPAATLAAAGAVGGTLLLPYSKEFFTEPFAALCVTLSIERAIARRPGSAGVALAMAALTRGQLLAFVPVLAWVTWKQDGWSGVKRLSASVALGVAAVLAYNVARFGDPIELGYRDERFSTPFITGATGLLFHPHKSLLLFAPIVVVFPFTLARLYSRARHAFWLIFGNLAITFALAACWYTWQGGWSWGPRLLLVGMIPAVASAGPWCDGSRRRRNAVAALFVLGAIVSAPAMIVRTTAQQLDDPLPSVGPSVVRQYQLIVPTAAYTIRHLFEFKRGMNREYLSLWQVNVARVMGPRGVWLALFLSIGLLAATGLSANALRRALERDHADQLTII